MEIIPKLDKDMDQKDQNKQDAEIWEERDNVINYIEF